MGSRPEEWVGGVAQDGWIPGLIRLGEAGHYCADYGKWATSIVNSRLERAGFESSQGPQSDKGDGRALFVCVGDAPDSLELFRIPLAGLRQCESVTVAGQLSWCCSCYTVHCRPAP
jgi:hypothetical protein